MQIPESPFRVINWVSLAETTAAGETGTTSTRQETLGNTRIRRVDYSPGYLADHWCTKGHVLSVLSGEVITELEDGRVFTLSAGMSYLVGDASEPHRSSSPAGASLLIID